MNAVKVVWLWQVTGGGQWRGLADTIGQAQQDAETCMEKGGMVAVVESAVLALNPETMEREYKSTGRKCMARRISGRVEWSEFAPRSAKSA